MTLYRLGLVFLTVFFSVLVSAKGRSSHEDKTLSSTEEKWADGVAESGELSYENKMFNDGTGEPEGENQASVGQCDAGTEVLQRLTQAQPEPDPVVATPVYKSQYFKNKGPVGKTDYKFDLRSPNPGYSNQVKMNFQNPYLRSQANLELGDAMKAFNEATFGVGKQVGSMTVDSFYKYNARAVSLVGIKKLTSNLSTTVSGQVFVNRESYLLDQRGNQFLGGVIWNY